MPRKRKTEEPQDQPQPGLIRKMLKLRADTMELLTQVAAFRGEKMIDCVHNLLVEEVKRNTEKMKERIDQLAQLPITHGHNDTEDED